MFFRDLKIRGVLETREYLPLLAPGRLNDRPNSFNPAILFGHGDRSGPTSSAEKRSR